MRVLARLLLCGLLLLAPLRANAVLSNDPVFPQTPQLDVAQILPATGTGLVSLITAGANGQKVTSILCSNTDTVSYVLQLQLTRASVNYPVVAITVPASAGFFNGTAVVVPATVFSQATMPGLPLDSDGNPFLFMNSGDVLKINTTTTVTAAKTLQCIANSSAY